MNDKKGVGKKKIRLDEIALTQKRHLGAENKRRMAISWSMKQNTIRMMMTKSM